MKIITVFFILSFISLAFGDASRFILGPELNGTSGEELKEAYWKKFNEVVPYNLGKSEFRTKNSIYTIFTCFIYDPQRFASISVEGCGVRLIQRAPTREIVLVVYDLPKVPVNITDLNYKFNKILSVLETQEIAINSLKDFDSEVKFVSTTIYEGKLTHKFVVTNKNQTTEIFIEPITGGVVGRRHFSEVHAIEASLYPVYEEAYIHNKKSDSYSLWKGQPQNVKLKHLNIESFGSKDSFHQDRRGSYNEKLQRTTSGQPDHWDYLDLKKYLDNFDTSRLIKNTSHQLLDGTYVSVLIHPSSEKLIDDKSKVYFPRAHDEWIQKLGVYFWVISESLYYPPIDITENFTNPIRLPDQSIDELIKTPYDALSVYHATTEFFDTIKELGYNDFDDSELKIRAYLYNSDPLWINNAFYTNGTINFTSYTKYAPNYARDNMTIWHELGHSVFHKLVGSYASKKGSGINEGISDFISHLIFRSKGFKEDFPAYKENRYYSDAKFNLANQAHDDGEAFGGVLKEILERKILIDSKNGIKKTADMLLDTLRLMYNSKNLAEQEFFQLMLIADDLGSEKRKAGEFRSIINEALKDRNFAWLDKDQTSISITLNGESLTLDGRGTRYEPFVFEENEAKEILYEVRLKLNESKSFVVPFPYTVKFSSLNAPNDYIPFNLITEKKQTILSNQDEGLFRFSLIPKCKTYNETDTSCITSIRFIFSEPEAEWYFGKRRIFFRVKKAI